MSGKTLLALYGSPCTNGSTAAMLRCATEAARQAGWNVREVSLYQQNIAFCRGCGACQKTGNCCIEDDIQQIAMWLKACDVVALAAPTYWANVPAAVKNMFDRLFGVAMEETATFPRPKLSSHQKYFLLTACNTPFPFSWLFGQSKGALRAMKEFFRTSGMKCLGQVTFAGAKGSGVIPPKVARKIRGYWK